MVIVVVQNGSSGRIAKPMDNQVCWLMPKCLAATNPESSFKTTCRRPQGTSPEPNRLNRGSESQSRNRPGFLALLNRQYIEEHPHPQ